MCLLRLKDSSVIIREEIIQNKFYQEILFRREKMDGSEVSRCWCYACSQIVSPILEVETMKCPLCQGGFVEEMASAAAPVNETTLGFGATESDPALSLWAPILLGMMSNPRRRRRLRRLAFGDDYSEDGMESYNLHPEREEESEPDRELGSIIRRRRRSSATILQLLQGIRDGTTTSQPVNSENDARERETQNRDGERVILINPFNQTIIVQGPYDSAGININGDDNNNQPTGSLGDYFIGPGLELLLQHLAENDPNRYGTPPAQKEVVEALPTVEVEETLQCSVCLEDFEMGTKAKQMPCKHKFHENCILPWLELHSSCPVCRYQLPWEESKADDSNGSGSSSSNNTSAEQHGDGRNENGRRFSFLFPWPFSSLFPSLGSQSGNGNSNTSASPPHPQEHSSEDNGN